MHFIKNILNLDESPNTDVLNSLHFLCKETFVQMHKELEAKEIEIVGTDFNASLYE